MGREIGAAGKRLRNEYNARAWLAWHIAALQRQKKLPPLKDLMLRERPRKQTWQEQLKIAELWQAALEKKEK